MHDLFPAGLYTLHAAEAVSLWAAAAVLDGNAESRLQVCHTSSISYHVLIFANAYW